jgi:hypothetical protein
MTSVEFERMLSAYAWDEAPCIRDLIFDYYCRKFPNDDRRPTEYMKKYTDALYERLVARTPQDTITGGGNG